MRVFLSAGEPSGDHHAALLVRELRSRMPDVCVLVDFPGFHWWLAWRAKRHGIPVVFYCPPQIWAWASWRIKKMRRLVDHVLSALPFEHDWFVAQGMVSTYVGHPFFDEHEAEKASHSSVHDSSPLVVLLPGSRGQELEANLGSILRAAAIVRRRVPNVRLTVASLHERHAAKVREAIAASDEARDVGISVEAGKTRELIGQATAAIAVSGSVSLELLAAGVPTVIVYRISRFAYIVQSFFRHARFITLVNLLACREPIGPLRPVLRPPKGVPPADPDAVFPEYLAVGDPSDRAAVHVIEWLESPAAFARARARIATVAARVAVPGSAARAAQAVLSVTSSVESPGLQAPRPSRAA
jgi:lipid-A-disaccharide synthase